MTIISQLSKDLSVDMLTAENKSLSEIPAIIDGSSTNNIFSPLTWYADKPALSDELYNCVQAVYKVVEESLKNIEEQ